MRIPTVTRINGSALVIVLVMTGLMGFGLASYMTLVKNQNLSVMRSLTWNSCIPIVEAGVEEAMTHINRSGLTNLHSAGWELTADGYSKTRTLGDSQYVVTISQADPPIIISEGYVPVPLSPAAPLALLATLGIDVQTGPKYTSRKVRVSTRRDGMWTHGMVAKGAIDLMGNNVQSDSFDSENSLYSTGGQYDRTKRRDQGDIATNSTIKDSLNAGNADIWGKASTGPGGSVRIGSNGSIGDLAWHAAGKFGIQPGWTNNDMNVYFRDVTRPYNGGHTPSNGTVGTTNFLYVLSGNAGGSGDYVMAELKLAGNDVMYVSGHCRLVVTSSIAVTGNGMIQIGPNASLELYMAGPTASIGGNGVLNQSGNALNFLYFGLPSHTSLAFAGNGAFLGAIYAPNATFTLGGGGSDSIDFIGASVSDTVKMNGHFKFHYDEALGRSGWNRGYLVNSWNEI